MRKNFIRIALLGAIAFFPTLLAKIFGGNVETTQWIEPAMLAKTLNEKSDLIVIDVRGADEFAGPLGHIKDARNIPMDQLLQKPETLSQYSGNTIALVCHTDKRSAKAAEALRDAGFQQVFVLRGGMARWNMEHLPVWPMV